MLTNVSTAFEPNPDSPVYLYVQVADYIAGLIESGELPPGARLLAERDLADEYGVSLQTARRAVQELRDRGLVQTVAVKGTFVVKPDA
jgi:DNA-binding GntR family transcriptional regulator